MTRQHLPEDFLSDAEWERFCAAEAAERRRMEEEAADFADLAAAEALFKRLFQAGKIHANTLGWGLQALGMVRLALEHPDAGHGWGDHLPDTAIIWSQSPSDADADLDRIVSARIQEIIARSQEEV
jgi:hypothetical protein